jgi:hypothetical protein
MRFDGRPDRRFGAALVALLVVTASAWSCGDDGFTTQPRDGGDGAALSDGGAAAQTDDDKDGYSEADGDCDDNNPNVHPKAVEICSDGIDNNCNGAVDAYEPDGDGDGYGPCQGDCNDKDKAINPSVKEVPDGEDNDCDGITDGDYDGDGVTTAQGDCNDQDPDVHPKAAENCYDTVDNNCNGYIDDKEPDLDKDGFGPCAGDCNDADASVYPGAKEIAGDGVDNNCDHMIDADVDGDGWTTQNGDCNDADAKIYPGAPIDCTSTADKNCNKTPDNTEKVDADNDGTSACDGDCDDADPSRSPAYVEIPGDSIDNDCDGKVDNPLKCDCGAGINEAQAADLCLKGVTITRGGAAASRGVRQSAYGAIKPRQGCGFFTVSTGNAWSTSVQIGTNLSTSGNPVSTTSCMVCTTAGSSQWVHPTPNGCCENKTENDPSWVRLSIKVPANAKGFKFDFIFLSAEYPEWVHTSYNDTFYVVQSSAALTKVQNISFDLKGQPLTVNNGWFENPSSPTQSISGTGYHGSVGSSSGWLTTKSPAKSGETMTLTFWIHDEGDHIYDSAVIIDNWRWIASKVSGPITIK